MNTSHLFHGIYSGVVLNNVDPDHRNRLQIQVPAVSGLSATFWAESTQPRGVIMTLPLPRQLVWVMYVGGDTTKPVWFAHGSDLNVHVAGAEPYNVVTMNTVQNVPAAKTFSGAVTFTLPPTVPVPSWVIAHTSGLQAELDSKYGTSGGGGTANPPPYPVTSVAGRLGAVVLTAADIGPGTFPGAYTFTGAVTAPNVVYSVTAAGNLASSGGQNPALSMTATPTFTSATIPTLTGPVNTTGNLSENGVRVVTATTPNLATTVVSETGWGVVTAVGVGTAYARSDHTHGSPPTPATSVAGRTGAVVLTAADVGAGTFPGSYTVSGTLNVVGTLSNNGTPAVTSVATRTGAVVLTAADLGAGAFPAGATYSTTGQFWVNVDSANSGTTGTDATSNGLRVGTRAGLMSYIASGTGTNSATYLNDNLWFDGTAWHYRSTSTSISGTLALQSGGLYFLNAPANAGAAGAAATLTQRFGVDASGNASIAGTATMGFDAHAVHVYASSTDGNPAVTASQTAVGGSPALDINAGTQHFYMRPRPGGGIEYINSAYNAVVGFINDGGSVGINTIDMASIRGNGWIGTSDWINTSNNSAYLPKNAAGTPDFNTLENRISGFYTDSATVNNPKGSDGSWWNVVQVRHQNTANNYGFQLASQMTGPSGLYYRQFQGGSGTDATVPGDAWYRVYTQEFPPMGILGAVSTLAITVSVQNAVFNFVAPASGVVKLTVEMVNSTPSTYVYYSLNQTNTTYLELQNTGTGPNILFLTGLSGGATYTLYFYPGGNVTISAGVEG